jgi:hypothetical protein
MPRIDVQTEIENQPAKCWDYVVRLHRDSGEESSHQIRLSWLDHELWSGGRRPPSQVVEAVVAHLVSHGIDSRLPAKFDAARARRWVPGIDQELKQAM